MAVQFKKATRKGQKLRMAIYGPSGSGKTYTALMLASRLGKRVAVMDSEHGSASLYADQFDFDAFEPESFSPKVYIETIRAAADAGYDVLVIDSLSHAWMGKGGALEMVDNASSRSGGNSFAAWKDVTPVQNQMVEAMLAARLHLIVTMRAKSEYVIEEVRGKKVPRKIGLAPVQRDGIEYEFQVVGDLDMENTMVVSKSRCRTLPAGEVIQKPDGALADKLLAWLEDGAPYEPPATPKSKEERYAERIRELAIEVDTLRDQKKVDLTDRPAQSNAESFLAGPDCHVVAMEKYGNKLGEEVKRLSALPDPTTYETVDATGIIAAGDAADEAELPL